MLKNWFCLLFASDEVIKIEYWIHALLINRHLKRVDWVHITKAIKIDPWAEFNVPENQPTKQQSKVEDVPRHCSSSIDPLWLLTPFWMLTWHCNGSKTRHDPVIQSSTARNNTYFYGPSHHYEPISLTPSTRNQCQWSIWIWSFVSWRCTHLPTASLIIFNLPFIEAHDCWHSTPWQSQHEKIG